MAVRKGVEGGLTVAQPLKESGVFPPMVVQMIGVGEQTGALDAMLSKIADFYEEEVDQAVANLLTLMEPVMILFLGITVGGIVIAMYLPLFDLISKLSVGRAVPAAAPAAAGRAGTAPRHGPPILERRLKRLMLLRVVMVTTLLLVAAYVEAVSETLLPVNPLYFLIVATYVLTVIHAVALRFVARPRAAGLRPGGGRPARSSPGSSTSTGGVRTGFMLLYPISVLSGSVLLYRRGGAHPGRAGHALLRGDALGGAAGLGPGPGPVRRALPLRQGPRLLDLRHRRGLRHRGPHRVLPLREPPAAWARGWRRPWSRWPTCEELNEVIVNSIHSGLITADAAGHVLYVNEFGAAILRQARGGGPRAAPWPRSSDSRLLRAAALRARAAAAGARTRLELVVRPARRGHGRPRHLRLAAGRRLARDGRRRLPAGLPGPDRHQAAGARGAHQGEAGRGGGDGGPARPRDPQPAGLHQRLGPGADGRAEDLGRAGAPPGHHHAGVAAALGHPEPVPLPGPALRPPRGAGGPPARWSRRRSRCCATGPRWARPTAWSSRSEPGPHALPGRSRPDHPGLLEPRPQRPGGHAGRRPAVRAPRPRRPTTSS